MATTVFPKSIFALCQSMRRRPEAEAETMTSQTAAALCGRRWWPQRTAATRLTCTGMGTTIFAPLLPATPTSGLSAPRDRSPGARSDVCWWLCEAPPAAFSRFHFARRFWNQILTWISDSRSWNAICDRSVSDKYFLLSNSRSSSAN